MRIIKITPELRAEIRRVCGPEIGATADRARVDEMENLLVDSPSLDQSLVVGKLCWRAVPDIEEQV